MTDAWHQRVAWKRGPLGSLHAQWLDEEIPGAACCSESAALSGPDAGFGGVLLDAMEVTP